MPPARRTRDLHQRRLLSVNIRHPIVIVLRIPRNAVLVPPFRRLRNPLRNVAVVVEHVRPVFAVSMFELQVTPNSHPCYALRPCAAKSVTTSSPCWVVNEAHLALDRLTPPAHRSTVRCRAKGAVQWLPHV